ncbi:hypothetical protein [Mesorhizobium sp. M0244]|uniref:hypothetical protein n=1 Tax=Mesorhizobium sp. M0244 TaxID=2956926 RepID=UPI0033383EE8
MDAAHLMPMKVMPILTPAIVLLMTMTMDMTDDRRRVGRQGRALVPTRSSFASQSTCFANCSVSTSGDARGHFRHGKRTLPSSSR